MSAFNRIFTGYIESQTKFLQQQESRRRTHLPASQGNKQMSHDVTKNENLPAVIDDDGFGDTDANDRLIQGTILKCVDGNWSAKDGTALPPGMQLIALATAQAIQRWQDNKPIETIVKKPGQALPDVDELNATIPEDEWEAGLDSEPRAPYVKQHIVYLLNPKDASVFTFINSTSSIN